ncbi:MAG TPA: hypothetical protein VGQ86_01775 [Candidatus Limnocylindria bacterium]|nr:hypothetical protein [Candidatus Limnocylindria bacterium]
MFGAVPAPVRGRAALLAPILLSAASAAVVLWQNAHVAVLVDLAYVLNTATRIAAGDVPYRDFPLAHAPLEFIVQAALIKAFGAHYFVQIAYVTILGGLATALTYAIVRRLLEGVVEHPTAIAAVLVIPLVPLGIYAVYPHPFYDSDACLAVLAGIAAVVAARDRPTTWRWLIAGAVIAVPVFVKQNIGGAFLVLMVGALAAEALARPSTRAGLRWCMAGLAAALVVALLAVQLTAGIDRYLAWTWTYALSGRGVALTRLREFVDPVVVWPAALILGLVLASRPLGPRARALLFLAGLAVPAVVSAFGPFLPTVPAMFPPLLIAASVLALMRWRADPRFETLLPLVVTGTTAGALMSQGVYGSTFGIFPLLVLLLASLVRELRRYVDAPAGLAPATGAAIAFILTVAGSAYTLGNARLLFADVNAAGPVVRSSFPSLAGLSASGPYVADLDAMLAWAAENVPTADAMVFLPGEDPAFFALGRRPRLPAVYFYDVASPYPPAEIARSADEVALRWVFVKDRLQLFSVPPQHEELVARLTEHATLVARVGPYRVFRR